MCVIIYKPKGAEMPSKQDLEKCFNHNPDGAGYMLPINKKVIIHKGFMTFNDFKTDLVATVKKYNIDVVNTPFVIHFRITTQGGVQQALCHPYPICDNYEQMRQLTSKCDIALAHNGIISLTSESEFFGGYWDKNTRRWIQGKKRVLQHNDTMTFIKDYASLIIDNDINFHKNENKCKLMERLISASKLAIMNKNGDVKLIGDFSLRDGSYYSNLFSFYEYKNIGGIFDDDYND
jgi:hypothetical protein